jgi:hypothetical protein
MLAEAQEIWEQEPLEQWEVQHLEMELLLQKLVALVP